MENEWTMGLKLHGPGTLHSLNSANKLMSFPYLYNPKCWLNLPSTCRWQIVTIWLNRWMQTEVIVCYCAMCSCTDPQHIIWLIQTELYPAGCVQTDGKMGSIVEILCVSGGTSPPKWRWIKMLNEGFYCKFLKFIWQDWVLELSPNVT